MPDIVNIDLTDEIVDELAMKGGDRSDFARLVGVVSDAGAASLLFDIVFPGHGDLAGDSALARASEKAGNVYLPAIMRTDEYRKIDGRRADQRDLAARWLWHPRVTEAGRPLNAVSSTLSFPELTAAARGIGSINVEPDDDGVYRRVPLLTAYRDGFVPALALSAACDRLGVDPAKIEVAFGDSLRLPGARLPNGTVKDIDIPIDEAGRMIIDYAGRWTDSSYPHYSLATILKAKNDSALADKVQAELDGALAIVCDLTTSSADYGPSPLERVYPKSGIHANVLDGILSDRFLREQTRLESLLYAAILAAMLWLAARLFRPLPGSLLALLSWAAIAGAQFLFFLRDGVMPVLAAPTLGFVLCLVATNVYSFFRADREALLVRSRMERYFAPQIMAKVLRDRDRIMSAEQKTISVLFSDIAGFTSWCSTQKPDAIHRTLNEYFETMTGIVFRHDGTVDKFIGDGLMAFFGDPIEQSDHAMRAVRTAIEMQQAVRALRSQWEGRGGMPIHIRIGINSGEAIVGDMGSGRIMAYTAIGSHVNLASRLEGKAPVDGVLVSAAVYEAVKSQVDARFGGRISAKGFSEEFDSYEIIVPPARGGTEN